MLLEIKLREPYVKSNDKIMAEDVNIKIGIAYHRKSDTYPNSPYLPIQVGGKYADYDLGIQKDSTGDNISAQNPYCSEMSASYWLWKNVKADYKGLFHYRRFMTFRRSNLFGRLSRCMLYYLSKLLSPIVIGSRYTYMDFSVIHISPEAVDATLNQFSKDLFADINKNDIDCYVLGYIRYSTYRNSTRVKESIGFWHSEYATKMIREYFPDFYPFYEKSLAANKLCSCNMIIAKSNIYDEYCATIFPILERYQQYMNYGFPSGTINNAMKRDSGYLAEILTDAYIHKLKSLRYKVKHLGEVVVDVQTTTDSQPEDTVLNKIKTIVFGRRLDNEKI